MSNDMERERFEAWCSVFLGIPGAPARRNGEYIHSAVKIAQAAWLAARATPIEPPEGWKLVPERPTQEMCQAGQWKAQEWPRFPLRISPIYSAMLAAAPSAPSDQQGGRT